MAATVPALSLSLYPLALFISSLQCDPNSPLAGLRALQERLGDLSYLHSNLKCSVSLSDYEKVNKAFMYCT